MLILPSLPRFLTACFLPFRSCLFPLLLYVPASLLRPFLPPAGAFLVCFLPASLPFVPTFLFLFSPYPHSFHHLDPKPWGPTTTYIGGRPANPEWHLKTNLIREFNPPFLLHPPPSSSSARRDNEFYRCEAPVAFQGKGFEASA